MNKTRLIKSASKLSVFKNKAQSQTRFPLEQCIEEAQIALLKEIDISELAGGNQNTLKNFISSYLIHLKATTSFFDPVSFIENIIWTIRTFAYRGVQEEFWKIMIQTIDPIVKKHIPEEDYIFIRALHDWKLNNYDELIEVSSTNISFFEKNQRP